MNGPEWITILIGCIACLLNGISQPIFTILFANLISVMNILEKNRYSVFFYFVFVYFSGFPILYILWTTSSSFDFRSCLFHFWSYCYVSSICSSKTIVSKRDQCFEVFFLVYSFCHIGIEINTTYLFKSICMPFSSRNSIFRSTWK